MDVKDSWIYSFLNCLRTLRRRRRRRSRRQRINRSSRCEAVKRYMDLFIGLSFLLPMLCYYLIFLNGRSFFFCSMRVVLSVSHFVTLSHSIAIYILFPTWLISFSFGPHSYGTRKLQYIQLCSLGIEFCSKKKTEKENIEKHAIKWIKGKLRYKNSDKG